MRYLYTTLNRYVGTAGQFGGGGDAPILDRVGFIGELEAANAENRRILRIWLGTGGTPVIALLLGGMAGLLPGLVATPCGAAVAVLLLWRLEKVWAQCRLHDLAIAIARATGDEDAVHNVMLLLAPAVDPARDHRKLRGPPGKVFVSYSSRDEAFVLQLRAALQRKHAIVWIDRIEGAPGHPLERRLRSGLGASASVVQVLTPNSVESSWVLLESQWARAQRMRVVHVLAARCTIPNELGVEVGSHIYVDLTRNDHNEEYARLVELLARDPGQPAPTSEPATAAK